MSTYHTILFFILFTYHILRICESSSYYPWTLEEEEKFQGKFCDKNANYLENLCWVYARKFKEKLPNDWIPEALKDLSCESLPVIIWSTNECKDVDTSLEILKCSFEDAYELLLNLPGVTVGLSRGKNTNDVAEYHYNSILKRWVPHTNHKDWLVGVTDEELKNDE